METIPLVKGTRVHVGGCGGRITEVRNDTIVVAGVYYYYDVTLEELEGQALKDAQEMLTEPWAFTYRREDIAAVTEQCSADVWDASKIKPLEETIA